MTGLNHGLSGGLFALTLPPFISFPLSFVSHFLLDMLPHYGIAQRKRNSSKLYRIYTIADTLITLSLAVFVAASNYFSEAKWEIFVCSFLATAPDYIWVASVIKNKSFRLDKHRYRFTRWHARIQKYEFARGIYVEIPLSLLLFYTVFFVLKP